MVEFAVVATLFFFLTFAMLDFGRMVLHADEPPTGSAGSGPLCIHRESSSRRQNPGQNLSRVDSIIAEAQQLASVPISNVQISSLAGGVGSAGGPGDTVTVSFTTNLELMTPVIARLFPNGEYTITSNATFKNEPFPPSSTHKGDPKETL